MERHKAGTDLRLQIRFAFSAMVYDMSAECVMHDPCEFAANSTTAYNANSSPYESPGALLFPPACLYLIRMLSWSAHRIQQQCNRKLCYRRRIRTWCICHRNTERPCRL